ncbi:DUF3379 family protein [Thiolapillus brandeum]|nr:DUF3379 family protein [Thiolapillus brandeum]
MKCEDFRKILLQDPSCADAAFLEHMDRCASCRKEWKQTQSFEDMLRNVILQPREPSPSIQLQASRRRLWLSTWARAASVLLLLIGGVGGYNLVQNMFPQDNLAKLVVRHVQSEPELLQQTEQLDELSVATVFAAMGFESGTGVKGITAASPCWMRKGRGVHLVVKGQKGAVTLLLMPGEYVNRRQPLKTGYWSGVLVPEQWGSLAVLASAGEDAGAFVDLVEKNIHWEGRPSSRRF